MLKGFKGALTITYTISGGSLLYPPSSRSRALELLWVQPKIVVYAAFSTLPLKNTSNTSGIAVFSRFPRTEHPWARSELLWGTTEHAAYAAFSAVLLHKHDKLRPFPQSIHVPTMITFPQTPSGPTEHPCANHDNVPTNSVRAHTASHVPTMITSRQTPSVPAEHPCELRRPVQKLCNFQHFLAFVITKTRVFASCRKRAKRARTR